MTTSYDTDGAPVIIGGGLAGLMTALALAPQPVLLLTGVPLGLESSSALAQGGIAASIGADDDASLHLEDTLIAGDGLCDETVAAAVLAAAPAAKNTPRRGAECRHGLASLHPYRPDRSTRTLQTARSIASTTPVQSSRASWRDCGAQPHCAAPLTAARAPGSSSQ